MHNVNLKRLRTKKTLKVTVTLITMKTTGMLMLQINQKNKRKQIKRKKK